MQYPQGDLCTYTTLSEYCCVFLFIRVVLVLVVSLVLKELLVARSVKH